MKLFTGPLSLFGAKAQIAVLEKRIACEVLMVPFDADDRYLPKHPDVARINPKGQVPVLIDTRDGEVVELFDSTQIFEYLEDIQPEPRLWPEGVAARARARQLELMCDEVLFAQVLKLFSLQDAMQGDAALAACAACAALYERLEARLGAQDYLAGPYSYADIGLYMTLVFAERKGAPLTAATPRLMAWRTRVGQRPAVAQVVGAMMRFLASQNRPVPGYLQHLIGPRG